MQISHHHQSAKHATTAGSKSEATYSEEVIASSGITFRIWRLYQHAWLICLAFPLAELFRESPASWWFWVELLALVGFAASYTWLMWPHPASQGAYRRAHSWHSLVFLSGLSVLVLVLSLADGPAWLWLFIGLSATAGVLLSMPLAFIAIVLFTLLPLGITLGSHGGVAGVNWWWLIALVLLIRGLGLDMIGITRMGHAIRALQRARRELARLAVIEERERLARDLHDVLGQTLSVITLKSELARCLVTEEPERCVQELAEIERVSRQMLREVRKTVAGYRQPTLANELEGACQLLEAAGVAFMIEQTTGDLPLAIDAVLAWVVREGVTNVIRHSRAQHCRIRLTSERELVCGEVLNDGIRQEDLQAGQTSQGGSGLTGLQERATTLGGTMEAGPLTVSGETWFRLSVVLPMQLDEKTASVPAGAEEDGA